MRVLIITPIKPFPLYQGNSVRVNFIYQSLKERGHYTTMIYYGMEGSSFQLDELSRQYYDQYLFVRSKIKTNIKSKGMDFGVDDWIDRSFGVALNKYITSQKIDCIIVNYVWFSWILEYVPDNIIKIIDTHDRFGGRRIDAEKVGIEPNWFYTTADEEKIGLERADIVLAITDEETNYFKKIGVKKSIQTVGYIPKNNHIVSNNTNKLKSTCGYIGSANPWNLNSLQKLFNSLKYSNENKILIAGPISQHFPTSLERGLISVGNIPDLTLFFSQIGYFINPMIGSTGLKIKTIDAMSYGCPILGLPDSFTGLGKFGSNYWGCFKNMENLTSAILNLKDRNLKNDRNEITDFYFEYKNNVNSSLNEIF
jgi:hypothetical protein